VTNVIVGRWTYVAYTYNGAAMTTAVYKEGVQANTGQYRGLDGRA